MGTFAQYLSDKKQDDLAMVVDHLKEFFNEFEDGKYKKVTFKNGSTYTLDRKLLSNYKKKVSDDTAKEGLIFETGYLVFQKGENQDAEKYPFFYIVRPIIGDDNLRLVFTSREDFLADWKEKGVVCSSQKELIDAFVKHVDNNLDTLVQRFTQLDFAHA